MQDLGHPAQSFVASGGCESHPGECYSMAASKLVEVLEEGKVEISTFDPHHLGFVNRTCYRQQLHFRALFGSWNLCLLINMRLIM